MPREFRPYIPQTLGDLLDLLGSMVLSSPTFVDKTDYLPGQNLQTTFQELSEGLRNLRLELGQERFERLLDMSVKMRTYFEADPEDKGDAQKGRELIYEMEDLIEAAASKS